MRGFLCMTFLARSEALPDLPLSNYVGENQKRIWTSLRPLL
jgi:hypothetical protein